MIWDFGDSEFHSCPHNHSTKLQTSHQPSGQQRLFKTPDSVLRNYFVLLKLSGVAEATPQNNHPLLLLLLLLRSPNFSVFLINPNMAFVSQLNQFPCKTLLVTPRHPRLTSKPLTTLAPNSVGLATPKLTLSNPEYPQAIRPATRIRAIDEDESAPETSEEPSGVAAGAVAVAEKPAEPEEISKLKKVLVDAFYGTDLGLSATSETRAEIVELITQLEVQNPTPAPTEALPLLNGKWILAYTSFAGLFPLLSRGTLPLVKVDEVSQTIDSQNFTVENSVRFSGPLATTSFSTNATFDVRSPKRVQLKFEEGVIGTPQLTDSLVIPEDVEFLGQKIDLAPFKGLLTSVQDTASSVAKSISSQPPFKFSISSSKAESWLLTTYLDQELRISRGDNGSVFVLIKEGSSLLTP